MADKVFFELDGKEILYTTDAINVPVMNVGALTPTGYINYVIVSGVCYVYFTGLLANYSGTNQWLRVAGPLPMHKLATETYLSTGNTVRISLFDGKTYIDLYKVNNNANAGCFCYPVNDNWNPS